MSSTVGSSPPQPSNGGSGIGVPAPEFPHPHPQTLADIVVPTPRQKYPEWTTTSALPSFPSFISLPDPHAYPGLYTAAIDTMRITSWRLNQHGPYEQVLRKAHVRELVRNWRALHPSAADYPLPPDARTLFVKTDDKHPAPEEGGEPLWTQACKEFLEMKEFEKPGYLRKTRAQHIRENELDGHGLERDEKLYLRIFKRYLVWREYVNNEDSREDNQPTRQDLLNFFAQAEVQENGATLADICHEFPEAKDIEVLVYRIEGIAVHTAKPDQFGDVTESVYKLKPAPTEEDIVEQITQALTEHGPLPLLELLELLYPFGFGHEDAIIKILGKIAIKTLTGDNFDLATSQGPRASEIHAALSLIKGYGLEDIISHFSDRISCKDVLLAPLHKAAYREKDGLWYARFAREGDELEDDEEKNRQQGTTERLLHMIEQSPSMVVSLLEEVAVWDSTAGRYVKKGKTPAPISIFPKVETTPVPPPSPTEVGAPPPPSSGKGKRKRAEDDEPEQPSKKSKGQAEEDAVIASLQCSGRTRAKKRCKLRQRRPAAETWYCSKHQ